VTDTIAMIGSDLDMLAYDDDDDKD
jgi:hypothetical protein